MSYLERFIRRLHELIGAGMICLGIAGLLYGGKGLNILLAFGFGSIIILLIEIKGIMYVNHLKQESMKTR
ncbi:MULTISPECIES: hypothetical protein [unclassified Legionella]|uniref:hypothetical protein n=1 Tax=unclassified Legionella TaxID=2622702 RepID=UPI001055384E|nr:MULTISPECIES: hypothetical protein [unclassified Legionella]MDI9819850.1 hypothetical protein [Legionella sp. PL877]